MDKLFIYAVSVLSFLLMPFCVEIHAVSRSGLGFSVSSCSDTSVRTQPPPAAFEVSGVVLDSASRVPVAGAAVIFGNTGTGGLTYSVTGSDGKFKVSVAAGDYSITVTHVRYYDFTYKTGIASVTELSPFALKENVESLEAASVTGSYIKRRGSNYTVSIKGNPKAEGLSTLSFMGTLPGVRGLSVNDRPAVIYINDRELKMSRDQIVQYLSTVPTESIEDIRVRPSKGAVGQASRRNAAIYIRTRRNESEFISAQASIAPEYHYEADGIFGILNGSFGYFDKKVSSLTYFSGNGLLENTNSENMVGSNSEKSESKRTFYAFNVDQSFVYDISDRHSVSFGVNLFYKPDERSKNDYSGGAFDWGRDDKTMMHREELFFQYEYTFGKRESSFKLTADVMNTDHSFTELFINAPEDYDAMPKKDNSLNWALQADLYLVLGDDMDLTIGSNYMGMYSNTEYPLGMEALYGTGKIFHVPYNEGIYSVYAEYYASLFDYKLDLTAGFRYEHAFIKTLEYGSRQMKVLRYDDFFPYVDLTYNYEKEGYYLSLMFDRSIYRPNVNSLVPYISREGEHLFEAEGLTLMPPEYYNEISLAQTFAGKHTLSLSYSWQKNVESPVYVSIGDDNIMTVWDSGGNVRDLSLSASTKFWAVKDLMWIDLHLNGSYNMLENVAGNVFDSWTGSVSANLLFMLPKSWRLSLSGSYLTPRKELTYTSSSIWNVSLMTHCSLGKNWSLTLYLSNFFNNT